MGCLNVAGRMAAMVDSDCGPVAPRFTNAQDVVPAGVLVSVPALLANGIYHHVNKHLFEPGGYYGRDHLLLLLAFLVLARVLSLEQVRYQKCGEWGNVIGWDRIPEVKTLRAKLSKMATDGDVDSWAHDLGCFWMRDDPSMAGILYVDGHVRTYHGHQTKQPRRYSSRDRLCMRSLMDYWVNDRDGKPFFVVTAMGTEGMLHHLRHEIVPRLLRDVPDQPTQAELDADPDRHRFIIVFDREGYSPAFFSELWTNHRIAALTYRKGTYQPWEHSRFTSHVVELPHNNTVSMDLAEMQSCDTIACDVPLREIRRLANNGQHQTSIITTCKQMPMAHIAGHMFARWSQENFLNYASRDLAIDRLGGYTCTDAPGEAEVINPEWRALDRQARRKRAKRRELKVKYADLVILEPESKDVAAHHIKTAQLNEEINQCQSAIDDLNAAMHETPKHITIKELPEEQQPKTLSPLQTKFMNTIKIIAYRAETAIVTLMRQHIGRSDDARALAKELFKHPADMIVDQDNNKMIVRIHHFTNPQASRVVEAILPEINATNTIYPGTGLRLEFAMVSKSNPPSQEP